MKLQLSCQLGLVPSKVWLGLEGQFLTTLPWGWATYGSWFLWEPDKDRSPIIFYDLGLGSHALNTKCGSWKVTKTAWMWTTTDHLLAIELGALPTLSSDNTIARLSHSVTNWDLSTFHLWIRQPESPFQSIFPRLLWLVGGEGCKTHALVVTSLTSLTLHCHILVHMWSHRCIFDPWILLLCKVNARRECVWYTWPAPRAQQQMLSISQSSGEADLYWGSKSSSLMASKWNLALALTSSKQRKIKPSVF